VKDGMWVVVKYEGEKWIGKVMARKGGKVMVRCLEKPLAVGIPKSFEKEREAIYYRQVFATSIVPKQSESGTGRMFLWA